MIKTGEILRKAREKKGFSLNEVALSLKISSKILSAIETGNEAQLPAKTFLRGFVQSYATYLRLDVDQVMAIFFEEVGSTKPKPILKTAELQRSTSDSSSSNTTQSNQDHIAPINQKSNTKTVVVIIIGIVLIGLILFTMKMIDKYTKEAQVETPVAVTEPIPESSPTPTPSPVASDNMSVAEPKPTETPATLSNIVAAKETPKPSTSPQTTPTSIPAASPTPTASPSISPTPEKPVAKSIELIIEALDNVEIEYSSNNGKKSSLKLAAEQVHTFKSKNGLKLSVSNGGAVNLILNGRDLGIPGNLGKSINLSY